MSKGDSSTPTPLHGEGTATSTPPLDAPLRASARWRQLRYARRVRSTRRGGDQHVVTEDGRYRSTAVRLRRIHALKTAFAVLIGAALTLINPVEEITKGTGVWAVITTIVVMQTQTLGSTTHKTLNRVVGTTFAAGAALVCGLLVNMLPSVCFNRDPSPLASVFVGASIFAYTGAATFLASSKAWASWSYALFLSALTFDFLLILEYRDDFQSGVYRVVMILVGALIAMVVTALPPRILASRELRGILADNLLDAAQAMSSVVGAFCSGSRLARISQICDDPEIECDIHATYQQIISSRPAYEAAVSAAEWEEWELGGGGDWATFRDVGTHMRRFIYSVVTLDEYTRHPVNGSAGASRTHFSELLAGPLTDLTAAVAKLLRAIADVWLSGENSLSRAARGRRSAVSGAAR